MPTFEIEANGETYTVEAPSEQVALFAVQQTIEEEERLTTDIEDVQGLGTKILDGLLLGYGDEAAAAMRAGIDVGVAGLFGEEASLYGGEFAKAYENIVAQQRDVEQRFTQQNPKLALAAEIAGGIGPGALAGKAVTVGAGRLASAAGTTRGLNAAVGAPVGAAEGLTYAIGEQEGDIIQRINDLDAQDALIVGLGVAAGALGGSLVRGTSAESKSIGEISNAAISRLGIAARSAGATTKDVADDIGEVAYKATEAFSPSLAKAGRETIHQLSDTANTAFTAMRPAFEQVKDKFDRMFQPVHSYAEKKVSKMYGNRLKRGSVNGQRVINTVDTLFHENKMFELRDVVEAFPVEKKELIKNAMADYANSNLTGKQRAVALRTIKQQLKDDELFSGYKNFIKQQEKLLNDMAPYTQSLKRTEGYMSVAADTQSKRDLATQSLEAERKAAERAGRLSTSDVSAKDKMKLARLNSDGTGLSSVGTKNAILNPIDSHHYWMRTHAQLSEMNKVFGLRGAQTTEELEEIAKGGFFGNQLREKLKSLGHSDTAAGHAVEIYNQVVWGSQRSMAKEFQAIRNVGYASAIGNPYGAALQFHDLFNSAWANGRRETMEALARKNGFDITVEDVGISQQLHSEIVNGAKKADGSFSDTALADWAAEQSQKLVDWAMGASGYRKLDGWTKGKIMSAGLGKEFNQLASDAAAWRNKWRNTFDKDELLELEQALKNKDTSNELVKQLAAINLTDLQPISASSSSLTQLSIPNARILYMLKGFAMTQLDLIRKRVIKGLKSGDRKEALKDMLAYMVISGGGYGVINETRQLIKLESPDYGNVPALAFYQMMSIPTMGAFGGNQYAAHLFQQNPVEQITSNFLPVVPVAEGVGKDLSNLLTKGEIVPNETLERMPIIGPVYKGISDKLDSE